MANNEKKAAAERALKQNREWANTWRSPGRLAQSPAKRHGLVPGGPQARDLREQESGWFPPGGVSALMPKEAADPMVRQLHRQKHPDEINSLGLGGEPYKESVQRPAYVKPSKPVAPEISARPAGVPAGAEGMPVVPADVKGSTVSPAPESGAGSLTGEYATGDPLGTSGLTAKRIRFGGKPGTRYEDGKGGFMEVTGADAVRKGGGTVSVVSGPGSNDFTKEEWEKMSGAQRTQANVDSYKAQTQAIRDSMAKPRQAGAASGGALTGQQSPFERRKTLREYGMATSELKNDLRRGRISAKKGKVIAATLMDHYDKALGGDLQKLMQEETRQGGQLMTAQERSAGLLDVAQERERGAAELAGMQGPEEFSMQQIGENPDGTKKFGLVGSYGTQPETGAGPVHDVDMSVEAGRAFVMAAQGNPEVFEERKQRFIAQHGEENWRG